MNAQVIEKETLTKLTVRAEERESFTDFYMTGEADHETGGVRSAEIFFKEAAELIARENIQVIQEKIFGLRSHREEILAAREEAYTAEGVDPRLPFTFVEGTPLGALDFAGLQIWGIASHPGRENAVTTIETGVETPGRRWVGDGFQVLYLPVIRAIEEEEDCVTCQGREMFENASSALEANGFTFSRVVRTWIYVSRLLDWYGEFNRIRTDHFEAHGLAVGGKGTVFPASTGIQGITLKEECFMDVLALDPVDREKVRVRSIRHTSRQEEPFEYGSAFSRGMAVEIEGKTTLYVSGTASIDAHGRTLYVGDPEAQALETLLNIAALLDDHGGSLESICSATVYCKDREAYDAYLRTVRLLCLPAFPTISVLADVCRHDLLIEIEAVAIV